MRLKPVELNRWERPDVEAIDVRSVDQSALKLLVFGDGGANEGGTNRIEHFFLRALHDGHEREHVLLLGDGGLGRVAEDHSRPQVIAAFFLHQPRPELGRQVVNARGFYVIVDVGGDGVGLAGNREGSQGGLGIIGRQRLDRSHALGQRLGNFACMPGNPNAGTVDAPPAAVDQDAVHHDIEILFPVIHLVVAQKNFAESRTVRLDTRVAFVLLDGGGASENQAARTPGQHRRAHVAKAGVNGNRLFRHSRLDKSLRHATGGPRLLGAGLEDQADLHRNDRQPKGVHAGRIAGQHHAENRSLRLVADRHAALFHTVATSQDVEIEAARQGVENFLHLVEHEMIFLHVEATHMLGQAGGRRLHADELIRRLRAVA